MDVSYVVPDLFLFEVASALRRHHRQHLSNFPLGQLQSLERDLLQLGPMELVRLSVLIDQVLDYEKQYSTYDVAYVVLAKQKAIPLCSLDEQQCKCARAAGVQLIEPGTDAATDWLSSV